MRNARRRLTVAVLTIAPLLGAPAAPAQAPDLDPDDVLASIERGVRYLKREQREDGSWPQWTGYPGGVTALCTLALLNAGVEPDDPAVRTALDYLRAMSPEKTYCVSLKAMALCAADKNRNLPAIQRCVDQLEKIQNRGAGADRGGWSYSEGGGADLSNSQFAVLALFEAQLAGANVSQETWEMADAYWRRTQNNDGSWKYAGFPRPSGSMTCAGVASLTMTSLATSSGDARVRGGRVECCLPHEEDEGVAKGLAWLGRNFSVERNPGAFRTFHYYYLYALERVGRLTAHRFIGEHDWYREGTAYLVRAQDPLAHFWVGAQYYETRADITTAMALLFLSKGRRPVLMAKLEHGDEEVWNQHRRDAANMTAVTENVWRLDLTWQQIDPEGASVEDLLQSPVIYISGSEATRLEPYAERLRDYVDRGGFIFAESCCDNPGAFREAFERLIAAMFPEPEYRLRQLRPAHPVWRMERTVRPESPYFAKLWAVEYGCRTCVVFCDEDLSCYWELNRPGAKESYPDQVRQRVEDAEAIGLNVLAYATNREPAGKEQVFVSDGMDSLLEANQERGVIRIAKLQHGGGCDDAPGALANLNRAAAQGELKLRIAPDSPLISLSDPNLFRFHLTFMHGRHEFRLTDKEQEQLATYLENGGTLLADSICASKAFTEAFRRELLDALPGKQLQRIPPDDPMFTDEYRGYDIRQVSLRDPQPVAEGDPLAARTRRLAPQLEGVKIDGRWAVIFSPYDLSCALEKHEAVECRGYTREDAARIGLNVILYSLNY